MKLRIISGMYARRNIKAPDSDATHPMSERVRNALFNILGDKVQGAVVLDAFAGSGAIGLEAISRGASHATFVERDRSASNALIDNVTLLGAQAYTSLVHSNVEPWIVGNKELFDIIFVDPPYDDTQFSTTLKLMGLLKPNGLMVLSYPGRGEAPTGTNGVVVVDNRSYGTAALAFYQQKDV
jgi:16S rRNA (guanine966-N2)-methyltransferase